MTPGDSQLHFNIKLFRFTANLGRDYVPSYNNPVSTVEILYQNGIQLVIDSHGVNTCMSPDCLRSLHTMGNSSLFSASVFSVSKASALKQLFL